MGSDNPQPSVDSSGADAQPRRVFVVAGMHRAGTSVIARALQALGVDLGDRLMSADQRVNARGFFEDKDIVELDDALLDANGADWKNLALLDALDWRGPAFLTARAQARHLLELRLQRSGQFGFKDPRVPRLIPFWQGIFAEIGATDSYVIAMRHPWSVIDSLTARDALDVQRSGWLWLTHLVCALRYTAGRPRVVVDYDRLLAAPEQELARMANGLGLPNPAPDSEEMRSYCGAFLSKELRHAQHAAEAAIPGPVPTILLDAFVLAQRLARDEADAGSAATDAEVDALYTRLAELSPLLAYAGATERAADQVPRLKGELDWAQASLVDASAYNDSLQATLRQSEAALAVAQSYSDDLQRTLRRKDEALAAAQAYNDDLQATIRRKDEELATAKTYSDDALATAKTYSDDLLSTLTRKEGELVAAHGTLDRIRERLIGRILLRQIARARDGG